MNKKGFSLIELLAVITLLGLVALGVYAVLDTVNKENKQKAHDIQAKNFINSAIAYVPTSDIVLPTNSGELVTYEVEGSSLKKPEIERARNAKEVCISLDYLTYEGVLGEEMENPLTGKEYDKSKNYICILQVTNSTKESIENELKENNIEIWRYDGNYLYYFKESNAHTKPNPSTGSNSNDNPDPNPYYTDYITIVYLNSWNNELPGYAGREITSFDKENGAQLFKNETWGIPPEYTIDQVTVYNYNNWEELATYYNRTWIEDNVWHARLSGYVFKRQNEPDLSFIGGPATLEQHNGSLRFVIIVTK